MGKKKKERSGQSAIEELDAALAEYLASDPCEDYKHPAKVLALRSILLRLGASKCLALDRFHLFHCFDTEYDQTAVCAKEGCGHEYARHFDWGSGYAPGCKYCDCRTFVPLKK
jgi:hypothetical protein